MEFGFAVYVDRRERTHGLRLPHVRASLIERRSARGSFLLQRFGLRRDGFRECVRFGLKAGALGSLLDQLKLFDIRFQLKQNIAFLYLIPNTR